MICSDTVDGRLCVVTASGDDLWIVLGLTVLCLFLSGAVMFVLFQHVLQSITRINEALVYLATALTTGGHDPDPGEDVGADATNIVHLVGKKRA